MKKLFFLLLALPFSLFAQEVTLSGTIKNAKKYLDSANSVRVIINDLVFGDQVSYFAKISENGTFTMKFPKAYAQDIMFEYKDDLVEILVSPGDQLVLQFDADSTLDQITFNAKGAGPNQDLFKFNKARYQYWETLYGGNRYNRFQKLSAVQKDSSELAYKKYVINRYQADSSFIEKYINGNMLSPEFKKWVRNDLKYECADDLMRYGWLHPSGIKGKRYVPSKDYYDFFEKFPVENPEAICASNYLSYLGEYGSYLDRTATPKPNKNMPSGNELISEILEKSITLTIVDKNRLKSLSVKLKVKDSKLDEEETKFMNRIFNSHQELLISFTAKSGKSISGALYPDAPDFTRDVLISNRIYGMIDAKYFDEAKNILNDASNQIKTPFIKQQILAYYTSSDAKFKSYSLPAGAKVKKLPTTTGDKLFADIIQKYKGKVVFIDFWATWCGPCLAEMPNAKILREKMIGKDVVFLYFGVQSPEKTWKAVMAEYDIIGEHFLLKDNDYNAFAEKFGINGIPHYVLVDKQGKVKDDHAKRPSDPALKTEIESLLKN